jgi:predicted nucleic acid-binding protein
VTVLDTSVVFDFLISDDPPRALEAMLVAESEAAAPDLLVFEIVAALRRQVLGGGLDERRAAAALDDLGDLAVELFPTLALRERAWALRENLTAGDALFVALAESLDEPLATRDRRLSAAARAHSGIDVIDL